MGTAACCVNRSAPERGHSPDWRSANTTPIDPPARQCGLASRSETHGLAELLGLLEMCSAGHGT